jgi:hypothetical protein
MQGDPLTCFYCGLNDPKVEAGGLWHCPNRFCQGPGAFYARTQAGYHREDGVVTPAQAARMIADCEQAILEETLRFPPRPRFVDALAVSLEKMQRTWCPKDMTPPFPDREVAEYRQQLKGVAMVAAANTRECILQHRGKKIIGALFGALPIGRADLADGTVTIVLDDGSGLTFSSTGAYWTEPKDDVSRAIGRIREQLEASSAMSAEYLRLAGEVAP